jgi:hypothetical protein
VKLALVAAALTVALSAAGGAEAARDPAAVARDQARTILSQPRYRGSSVPRPLHGALVWTGKKLAPVARPFHWLGRHLPGGEATVWVVLAALVILAAVLIAGRAARRRGGRRLEQLESEHLPADAGPAALERAAGDAEQAGDHALALRLRFRAGLLRLARARVIPLPDSVTSGQVRRLLRMGEFDKLARMHDEVVYGGRVASADDSTFARVTWPHVLQSVGPRR